MKRYVLNPKYILRNEGDKVYILGNQKYDPKALLYLIHPVYAIMLSFFKGDFADKIFNDIALFFNMDNKTIEKHLSPLINNENPIVNGDSCFPPNMIIEYSENIPIPTYTPEDFRYKNVDLHISRFKTPSDIICNVTMKCLTSCIYCYADRKGNTQKMMPVDLFNKIIDEAHKIGVLRFQLMGGEVLLHDDWKSILTKMSQYDYQPSISTKIPLTKEHIETIKELHLNRTPIQISLDTMLKDNLYKITRMKDPYYDNMINTFQLLEAYKMNYTVHTVISNINDHIEDMNSLIHFFKDKKYLWTWNIDTAKCSMYIGKEYSSYKSSVINVNRLRDYLKPMIDKGTFPFKVKIPSVIVNKNHITKAEKSDMFENRTMCSANLNSLYILPDGKVTICEELYWHPRFLLGDLSKQSIMEIWNSPKAKDLFFLQQKNIQESSPCRTCDEYTKCRRYKHVCWRNVILAFGPDKWDYPDPYCPKAPHIEKDISL